MRIKVVCLDMHVTEIKGAVVQLPGLFMDECLDPLPGIHIFEVHLPVEDVVAGADVNESVLHCWGVSWTLGVRVRT